jgi:hypothetical protein
MGEHPVEKLTEHTAELEKMLASLLATKPVDNLTEIIAVRHALISAYGQMALVLKRT